MITSEFNEQTTPQLNNPKLYKGDFSGTIYLKTDDGNLVVVVPNEEERHPAEVGTIVEFKEGITRITPIKGTVQITQE